ELLESVRADSDVLAACRRLKAQGFTLALDDFVLRAGEEPLLELCDIWKVDFLTFKGDARTRLVRQHSRPGLTFLAEKVETHEDFVDAKRDGFALFQGYFFCRPQMLNASEVPGSKLTRLKLLEALNRASLDFEAVQQILKQDVALLTRLL